MIDAATLKALGWTDELIAEVVRTSDSLYAPAGAFIDDQATSAVAGLSMTATTVSSYVIGDEQIDPRSDFAPLR